MNMGYDFQKKIKPGGFAWRPYLFINQENVIPLHPVGTYVDIFCQIIESEFPEDRQVFAERPDLRMAHCYSKVCVEGDLYQAVPLYTLIPITHLLFETARQRRWRISLEHLVDLDPRGALLKSDLAKSLLMGRIKAIDWNGKAVVFKET